jgi:hypothetical protein
MFIDARCEPYCPPSGGPCQLSGANNSGPIAKHGPPDGGRGRLVTASINMALLTEGGDVSSASKKDFEPLYSSYH